MGCLRYYFYMAKKSRKRNSSKQKGYGIHNVARLSRAKDRIRHIKEKKWEDINSIDLTVLYHNHWKTESISQEFGVRVYQVLNKLRCNG